MAHARRTPGVEHDNTDRSLPLLTITDLHTHIRMRSATVKAVDGLSLSIRAGETVGLVGESGCGKTMTGMSILRLLPKGGKIASGSIVLDGQELTTLAEPEMRRVRGKDIGMVFQDPMTSLNPTMTIGDQVAEPVQIHLGAPRRAALDRALEVLDLVGLPKPRERLDAFPHQLSGGLRQRVVIAMALACEPKLLIADEPTTALDVTIQAQILGLLDDLRSRLHMGLLLVTHDLGVVAGHADYVFVMYAGRIVEAGETDTIFLDMKHPYTEALLDSVPAMEASRQKALYSIPGAPPDLANPPRCCRFSPRCRYAKEVCKENDPQLTENKNGHAYACFFPVGKRKIAASYSARESHGLDGPAAQVNKGEKARDLLVLDDVTKEFPITKGVLRRRVGSVKAVSTVSFSVGRGEIFGLVGESGCGKTTIGRLVAGLEKPDSGRIVFDGTDTADLGRSAQRRRCGDVQLIFQDAYASLDPRMRVQSTLKEPMSAQRIGTPAYREARIRSLLDEVGLPRRALDLYPHEFSGGQRQRIGLARALTVDPRLIVADEPVSALDVSIQAQILNLLRRLQRERDLTYIVISHDLAVVRFLADRVGIMYLGKLVELGPVDDVYRGPAHPYTAGLLEAIPLPDPQKARVKKAFALRGELPSPANPPSGCRFRTRCPRAQEICAVKEPSLRAFGTPQHEAACHFPLVAPLEGQRAPEAVSTG